MSEERMTSLTADQDAAAIAQVATICAAALNATAKGCGSDKRVEVDSPPVISMVAFIVETLIPNGSTVLPAGYVPIPTSLDMAKGMHLLATKHLYDLAVNLCREHGVVGISFIQRQMGLTYRGAGDIVDQMVKEGFAKSRSGTKTGGWELVK